MRIARGTTTVAGIEFSIFSDFILRGMLAINNVTGEELVIRQGGYLSRDLPIRKAIASRFNLPTFRAK